MTQEQQETALRLLRTLTSSNTHTYADNYDDVGRCIHCQEPVNHLSYCPIGKTKEFLKSFERFT